MIQQTKLLCRIQAAKVKSTFIKKTYLLLILEDILHTSPAAPRCGWSEALIEASSCLFQAALLSWTLMSTIETGAAT
jgi:hypothetical protein